MVARAEAEGPRVLKIPVDDAHDTDVGAAGLVGDQHADTPHVEVDFDSSLTGAVKRVDDIFVAVAGVSFDIYEGEIFGLLGPNGAGKSTTIRMLSTLLEPTAGTARINGHDVVEQANAVRQSLGAVLTGERSIYWKLSGRENLEYFSALYHIPPALAKPRIQEQAKAGRQGDIACIITSFGIIAGIEPPEAVKVGNFQWKKAPPSVTAVN